MDFGECLVEDDRVVLVQPVAEERVRHPNAQEMALVCDKRRRLEPGRINMLVDFGLDAGEDLVPDVAGDVRACGSHWKPLLDGHRSHFRPSDTLLLRPVYEPYRPNRRNYGPSCGLRPPETRVTTRIRHEEQGENRGFSTFFSTVVENFGGRPYGAAGEGDCSTRSRSHDKTTRLTRNQCQATLIDTPRHGSLVFKFLRLYSSVAGDLRS